MSNKLELCLNCDDFGLSPEIDKGILELIDLGLCKSTSVMPKVISHSIKDV